MSETPTRRRTSLVVVLVVVGVLAVALTGALVAALAGDSAPPTPTAEDERQYLEFARYLSDDVTDDDAQLLRAGYAQCRALASGATEATLRLDALRNGLDPEVFDAIFLAARNELCPG